MMNEGSDIFDPKPPARSKEFWDALVALGGTPKDAALHIPDMTEAAVAAQMAEARGRIGDGVRGAAKTGSGGRNALRSNWGRIRGS